MRGSNILFTGDFDGLVIHPNIPGMYPIKEDRQNVWMEAGSGEIWDEFVKYCVDYQLGGVENLSLIPGTVGAAPVQNIGAYGQEASNVIETVKGYHLDQHKIVELSNRECQFSYRNSIFKSSLKGRYIITSVVFKLDKFPEFHLNYSQLEEKVNAQGKISLQSIKKAVNEIRSAKLPDVKNIGSAGSFFKNPVVDVSIAETLRSKFPGLPGYPYQGEKVKLAAGWLIEQAGWKGFREGDAGVHEKHALILVNFGKATGREIFNLSEKIKQSVFEKFGVEMVREVNCV